MNLSAPKQTTFIVAVALVALGLASSLFSLGPLADLSSLFFLLGFLVLAAGCFVPTL